MVVFIDNYTFFCKKHSILFNVLNLKKSKLFSLFNTLDRREIREFSRFVRSPFFNQQEKVVQFLDFLAEYRLYLKLTPTKEKAFSVLYPNEAYSDVKIRLLMSTLHRLLEHYISYQAFFQDDINPKILLAGAYRKRGLPQHFQRCVRQIRQQQDASPYRNADFFNERYRLQLEEYQFLSTRKRTQQLNLQEISDTIDISYLLLKLQQTCFLLAHQRMYKTEYDFGLLPEVITYIEEKGLLDIPAIAIYYYCYYSLVQPETDQHFKQFKQLLLDNAHQFPTVEIRDLLILAINYCIKKLNDGNSLYAREGLDLYKKGLESDFLFENGLLSRFTYNNIVAMGLGEEEFTWVDEFIRGYKNALEKDYRESTYNFNLARLEYERKNYDASLLHLQQAEYKDLLNNLIAKTLQIKIYYELQEFDLLESHLDSLKIFISRKKVLGYHRKNYLNIIYYTKKLLHLNNYDQQAKEKLRQAIEAEEVLKEKDWLLAQLKMQ